MENIEFLRKKEKTNIKGMGKNNNIEQKCIYEEIYGKGKIRDFVKKHKNQQNR